MKTRRNRPLVTIKIAISLVRKRKKIRVRTLKHQSDNSISTITKMPTILTYGQFRSIFFTQLERSKILHGDYENL